MSNLGMSWEELNCAIRRCGDSFYVLDLAKFAANYRGLENAFRRWYEPIRMAYSYKTNYLRVLCQWVDQVGGLAEVVSGAEYAMARALGVAPERIIFNGPYKSEEELEFALLEGAQVNLDGERELRILERLAAHFPDARLRVGLRLGADSGRFGFPALNPQDWERGGELSDVVERIWRCGAFFEAVHVHSSWGDRSASAHGFRAERVLGFCQKFFGKAGPLRIDLGGGFYSPMPEAVRSGFSESVSDFEEYGEEVAQRVARQYPVGGPELVLEPGTALVADAMWLVVRVLDCKKMGGRRVAVTSGSVHTLRPTRHGRELPMEVLRVCGGNGARAEEATDLVGYTCMEDDCLARAYPGPVDPGDIVVFGQMGAYTVVMKPPFIQPAPAVLCRYEDGRVGVARQRQTWWEMFGIHPEADLQGSGC